MDIDKLIQKERGVEGPSLSNPSASITKSICLPLVIQIYRGHYGDEALVHTMETTCTKARS